MVRKRIELDDSWLIEISDNSASWGPPIRLVHLKCLKVGNKMIGCIAGNGDECEGCLTTIPSDYLALYRLMKL